MTRHVVVAGVLAGLAALLAAPAAAQDADAVRPAGSTLIGDTGLWFVPTAEVLDGGAFAAGGHFVNFDREQGFSNVRHLAGSFAAGVGGRAEIFGSVRVLTRIDRDVRPLFGASPRFGGVLNDYPLATSAFSGNQFGDVLAGVKFNLLSEARMNPAALAVRGFVKLPTGDDDAGVSSGKVDGEIDLIVSKATGAVEIAGFGGFAFRSDPDDVDVANGVTWGFGVGAPVRGRLQAFGEIGGEAYLSDSIFLSRLVGPDGGLSALQTELRSPLDVTVGLRWNSPAGLSIGGGLGWAARHPNRSEGGQASDVKDRLSLLFRVGYHPGVKVYLPPPPDAPPPPANRPPTVSASCDPCRLEFGEETRLRADAQDPDGDPIEYRWTAPAGELPGARNQATQQWRAPEQDGPVPVTVTVSDGRGGSASGTVTIQVDAPPPPPRREYVFEDVHFDFDRYTLRPGAARVLDEVVAALEEDPGLNIEIEGHTCNIGTAEYNLALGERRANSVREYLTGQGAGAGRLQTISYGEERPAHDNAREETRRLNRRAALVVRLR